MQGEKQQMRPSKIIQYPTSLQSSLGVSDCSPWIGNIKEQRVCFVMFSFDVEPIGADISPVRCYISLLQVLKELFSELSSFFIELKCVKPAGST